MLAHLRAFGSWILTGAVDGWWCGGDHHVQCRRSPDVERGRQRDDGAPSPSPPRRTPHDGDGPRATGPSGDPLREPSRAPRSTPARTPRTERDDGHHHRAHHLNGGHDDVDDIDDDHYDDHHHTSSRGDRDSAHHRHDDDRSPSRRWWWHGQLVERATRLATTDAIRTSYPSGTPAAAIWPPPSSVTDDLPKFRFDLGLHGQLLRQRGAHGERRDRDGRVECQPFVEHRFVLHVGVPERGHQRGNGLDATQRCQGIAQLHDRDKSWRPNSYFAGSHLARDHSFDRRASNDHRIFVPRHGFHRRHLEYSDRFDQRRDDGARDGRTTTLLITIANVAAAHDAGGAPTDDAARDDTRRPTHDRAGHGDNGLHDHTVGQDQVQVTSFTV